METLEKNIYPYGREAGVVTKLEPFVMSSYTPVDYYEQYKTFVKRDDLCCNIELFSKARGFWIELSNIKEKGITQVGWEEAGDYRAAKLVASICKELGLSLTVWGKPIEKLSEVVRHVAKERIEHILKYNANVIFYDRKYLVKIHWYQHRKEVQYMIPLGGDKTFMRYAISQEVKKTLIDYPSIGEIKDWVVCVSTGGLLLGLLDGINSFGIDLKIKIHAILIQDRKPIKLPEQLKKQVNFYDMGWKYYDLSDVYPKEFPCNLQYDAKAWKWLIENRNKLGEYVFFWNAGA